MSRSMMPRLLKLASSARRAQSRMPPPLAPAIVAGRPMPIRTCSNVTRVDRSEKSPLGSLRIAPEPRPLRLLGDHGATGLLLAGGEAARGVHRSLYGALLVRDGRSRALVLPGTPAPEHLQLGLARIRKPRRRMEAALTPRGARCARDGAPQHRMLRALPAARSRVPRRGRRDRRARPHEFDPPERARGGRGARAHPP